jgi:hypothetical protein
VRGVQAAVGERLPGSAPFLLSAGGESARFGARIVGGNTHATQLEQAVTFFHMARATRFIREADELQAAIAREQEEAAQPQA